MNTKIRKTKKEIRLRRRRRPSARVFTDLVNRRAFIDKVVVSATGNLNATFRTDELGNLNSKSIYRPGGHYAACIFADWQLTGNPISIHHGKMVNFPNVPPLRFTMQSEASPMTAAQVNLFAYRCTAMPPKLTVSSLELTFDFTGSKLDRLKRLLIHAARKVTTLCDDRGWQTVYVGSARSAWQVRIYQKTKSVIRCEFILRRRFLARHGIHRPEDVLLLRRVDVWKLVSFRRFSCTRASRATRNWKNRTARRLVLDWYKDHRSRESLLHVLKGNSVPARAVFRRTRVQKMLKRMQQRLIW